MTEQVMMFCWLCSNNVCVVRWPELEPDRAPGAVQTVNSEGGCLVWEAEKE